MAGVLFEDIFDVKDIDPEGKKFDRGKLNFLMLSQLLIFLLIDSHPSAPLLIFHVQQKILFLSSS
jgi:hypothetical protein